MKRILFSFIFINSTLAFAKSAHENIKILQQTLQTKSPADCLVTLPLATKNLLALQESAQLKLDSEAQGETILQSLYDLRNQIRHKVLDFNPACVDRAKELMTASRLLGDLVGIYAGQVKQLKSEQIKFQNQLIPLKAEAPSYKALGQKLPEFQSGDLMITKGVSFVSSTISKISQPASVFSHIVFVHRDDKKVQTLESYIGDGAKIYEMDFALKNENARILLLRAKDQDIAKKADRHMYQRIRSGKVPYDYDLDFADSSKVSCEEIAYEAYNVASQGRIKIPQFSSRISLRDTDFAETLGLKNGILMAPTDMETDSRFEVISDWTDLRLVRDSWRKDMVISEMFRWMNKLEYNFVNNLNYLGLKLFLGVRLVPLFGDLVNGWLSVASDAPNSALVSMDRIRTLGSILLVELEKQDNSYFQRTGRWMSQRQLQVSLENFRKRDRQNYLDPNSESIFHQYFRENNLVAQ